MSIQESVQTKTEHSWLCEEEGYSINVASSVEVVEEVAEASTSIPSRWRIQKRGCSGLGVRIMKQSVQACSCESLKLEGEC